MKSRQAGFRSRVLVPPLQPPCPRRTVDATPTPPPSAPSPLPPPVEEVPRPPPSAGNAPGAPAWAAVALPRVPGGGSGNASRVPLYLGVGICLLRESATSVLLKKGNPRRIPTISAQGTPSSVGPGPTGLSRRDRESSPEGSAGRHGHASGRKNANTYRGPPDIPDRTGKRVARGREGAFACRRPRSQTGRQSYQGYSRRRGARIPGAAGATATVSAAATTGSDRRALATRASWAFGAAGAPKASRAATSAKGSEARRDRRGRDTALSIFTAGWPARPRAPLLVLRSKARSH